MDEEVLTNEIFTIIERYSFDKIMWERRSVDSRIIEDLGINSARIVDIIIDVEERFDIEVDDQAIESIYTINDLLRILKSKLPAPSKN
jgi:acyl carrier protein